MYLHVTVIVCSVPTGHSYCVLCTYRSQLLCVMYLQVTVIVCYVPTGHSYCVLCTYRAQLLCAMYLQVTVIVFWFPTGYDLERMRVHKKIPPGAYVNVTGETGKRVYMKLKSKEALKQVSSVVNRQLILNQHI